MIVSPKNFVITMTYFSFVARSFCLLSPGRAGNRQTRRIVGGNFDIITRNLGTENSAEHETTTSSSAADEDVLAEYRNKNNIRDQVFSAMSSDGSVKVTACTARNLVNDLMIAHTMTATPADALGRTVVCALLISNGMQEEQTVQLTMKGG